MQIDIPDPLFRRLQKHATPLVDTTLSVLERLTDFYEHHNRHNQPDFSSAHALTETAPDSSFQLDPKNPPSLLHTRVHGEFGVASFSNWNDLLRTAHIETFQKKARSFEALRQESLAQIKKGEHSNEGYHYLSEIDISLQGVDANRAWLYALRLAIYLRVPLRAYVEWRHNDKAAHPGKRALLTWMP